MSADVDLDTVGSCILFYCRDKLLVIHVLLLFSGLTNLAYRPTSRLVDGVGDRALGDLTGDPRAATQRDLSPEVATSSRHHVVCLSHSLLTAVLKCIHTTMGNTLTAVSFVASIGT